LKDTKSLKTYNALQQHYGKWLLGYDWDIYGCGTYRLRALTSERL